IIENTDSHVKILSLGPKEEVIPKKEIANFRVSELSVMPEGLEQMPDEEFRNLIWYIFSPPQDKKPFSIEQERQEMLKAQTSVSTLVDGESVALWNPEWNINTTQFDDANNKLPEYHGKRNVLMTHPFDEGKPATITRILNVPAGRKTTLTFNVAAHNQGDWMLRVYAGDQLLKEQLIGHDGERWKTVSVDLSKYAGSKVPLRLENKANNWDWEFGYWHNIQVISADEQRASK
ncbi:MAG TPA: dehydrogenase, partial [Verrucomicrobiae bacterium]|nr:dehydrogenase [Verrucomicrobiae bacterium]